MVVAQLIGSDGDDNHIVSTSAKADGECDFAYALVESNILYYNSPALIVVSRDQVPFIDYVQLYERVCVVGGCDVVRIECLV